MTDPLTPPPARDLPPARYRQIRAAVLQSTQPSRPRRRWALLVAVLAGAVALAALVVGVTWPRVSTAPLVARPTTATPSPGTSTPLPARSARPTPVPPAPSGPPEGRATDQGPLSTSAVRRLIASCAADLGRRAAAERVHFARRTSIGGGVVLFTATDGQSYLCSGDRSALYDGSESKTRPLPTTSDREPVIEILAGGAGIGRTNSRIHSEGGTAYLVSPQVASVQMRLTFRGRTGPWYDAAIEDGYAYASAELEFTDTRPLPRPIPDTVVETRAYDQDGRRLPVSDEAR